MKEVITHVKDKIEIVNQVQQKKLLLVGSINPHSGHILYEFNRLTNELFKARHKQLDAKFYDVFKTNKAIKREVEIKENHFYVTALNPKNAIKKICKELNVRYVIDATNE